MKRIVVKNLGPIRNTAGVAININKVTVLCGTQGAGKSTVAKLISLFCWIEKALTRGDFLSKELKNYDHFRKKYCAFHGIQNYFREDSYIRFEGDKYVCTYENGKFDLEQVNGHDYQRPQVMYIPAERNLLNVVENADKMKGIPASLDVLLGEYRNALKALTGSETLPIPGYSVQYDKLNRITWLVGNDFKVRMNEAASGFQSLLPTVLVSRHLQHVIEGSDDVNSRTLVSQEERERKDKMIQQLLKDKTLDDDTRLTLLKQLSTNARNSRFINLVEEIEQNLFPTSQKYVLYELLKINNRMEANQLVLTTHSPYVLSYLTLAVKAGNMLAHAVSEEARSAVAGVVDAGAETRSEQVSLYELSADGEVRLLSNTYGVLDDDNYLNNALEDTNELYDRLMDIEEGTYAGS